MQINNIAQQISRYQNKLYFRYRQPIRLALYWLRRIVLLLWVLLVAIGLVQLTVKGAENLIRLPMMYPLV